MPAKEMGTQLSDGSDDSGLMVAVAKQVQNTLEKKRKDNESKFLALARSELAKSASTDVAELQGSLDDMKAIFDGFVMQYAAAEDDIRGLWERLLVVHRKFLVPSVSALEDVLLPILKAERGFVYVTQTFTEKNHTAVVKHDAEREKGQVKGMATSKKAVEDCDRLIRSLVKE